MKAYFTEGFSRSETLAEKIKLLIDDQLKKYE